MKQNFEKALTWVFIHEGGKSTDPRDPGNWTGGKVNVGVLKGTNFGISAKAYPTLDIMNLNKEAAKVLYRRDYWDKICGDNLPAGLDYAVFDAAVNSGPARAARWLQQAVQVPVDGIIGAQTLAAVHKFATINENTLIENNCNQRLAFMKRLATWKTYGKGWQRRVNDVKTNALKLAAKDTTYILPSFQKGANYKAREDDIKTLSTKDGKAVVGAGVATIGIAAQQCAEIVQPHIELLPVLKWAFVGLTIIGIGVTAFLAMRGILKKEGQIEA